MKIDALTLMYGYDVRDNIKFCQKHDVIIKKYAHALMTLWPSGTKIRESWIDESVKPQEVKIVKEFCKRACAVWELQLWKDQVSDKE